MKRRMDGWMEYVIGWAGKAALAGVQDRTGKKRGRNLDMVNSPSSGQHMFLKAR